LTEALHRWISAYLGALPAGIAGQRGHDTTFRAASVLVWGFGLSAEAAWEFILEYNARCEPPWSDPELRHKLHDALTYPEHQYERSYLLEGEVPDGEYAPFPPSTPKPKPEYQPEALARLASRIDFNVTPEYLEARSKFTCSNRSPAGVLHKCFLPAEKVLVFNVFESQGCEVWEQ
jgi:hypothetical protein